MKFSKVTFRERTEISGMPRANEFSLSLEQGTELELDATGAGVIARNPKREGAVWIPVGMVAFADVHPGSLASAVTPAWEHARPSSSGEAKRGPGRPKVA